MEVILYRPQIPQNTGNIIRTCKVTGSKLTLVRPLGFSVSDKALKRAGLDYFKGFEINLIDDLESFLLSCPRRFYFFSSRARQVYTEPAYRADDILIFGSETDGLAPVFWEQWPDFFYTLPMVNDSRCLNLANTVSIVLYEAWRQQGFRGRKYADT